MRLAAQIGVFCSTAAVGHHPFGQIRRTKRAHHAAYTPQDVPASPALMRQGDTRTAQIWAFSHPNCQQREIHRPQTSKNMNLRRYLQSKQGSHSNASILFPSAIPPTTAQCPRDRGTNMSPRSPEATGMGVSILQPRDTPARFGNVRRDGGRRRKALLGFQCMLC